MKNADIVHYFGFFVTETGISNTAVLYKLYTKNGLIG